MEEHWHDTNRRNRMNEPNHHQIATYLIDYALSELVKYVMEDTGCSIEEAMECRMKRVSFTSKAPLTYMS